MKATLSVPVTRVREDGDAEGQDFVTVEEPLEIRVGDRPLSVTMRTPGDDFELALGFLFTEGVITSFEVVDSIRHWGSPNVVRVALREGTSVDWEKLQRHFYATSSCGVCGKTSIEAIRMKSEPVAPSTIDPAVIHRLPSILRQTQTAFQATGGIHAAAIVTTGGELVASREDAGRHNAVDKVIGAMLQLGAVPLRDRVLVVSGRTSFEVVQKAVMAGVPILAAVGAPTSLAVELARDMGMTLLGFVRDGRYNVYR